LTLGIPMLPGVAQTPGEPEVIVDVTLPDGTEPL
jgi:hypothetical protein